MNCKTGRGKASTGRVERVPGVKAMGREVQASIS